MKTWIILIANLLIFVLIPLGTFSQDYLKTVNPDSYKNNFRELARQINMYYDTASNGHRGGYKQWKRSEWFAMHHLDENGMIGDCAEKNIRAIEEMKLMSVGQSRMPVTGDWFNLGHASVTGTEAKMGRVNSVAFDPLNGSIIYVASTGGGIWKSFNNGDSWTNLTVDLPILGVADIVVSPAPNNHILYALTGDLSGGANVYVHTSIGVIKSYNGGLSWVRTNFTANQSEQLVGYKLLMHPNDPAILYAATTNGIRETTNGGDTWNLISSGDITDIEFKPGDPNTIYFTRRGDNNFFIYDVFSGTTNNTFINTFLNIDRMSIAVTPDNSNAVYILCGPGYQFFGAAMFNGLFYSGDSGGSFTMRTNLCNDNHDLFNSWGSLSGYANALYVDPFNENYVIAAGWGPFNSVNGGVNLAPVTANTIHVDQHNVQRNPVNGQLWLSNDGGVYRSFDNGNSWENKSNGLIINEYYRISGTNNSVDLLIGGTQDNGHFLRNISGGFDWVLGGDGMDNYFNSFDMSIVYASSQNGGLARSVNFGGSFSDTNLPNAGGVGNYPWITPFVQQPPYFNPGSGQWENTDVIYVYSYGGIMRGTAGNNWVNIGPSNIGQASGSLSPSMVICADNIGFTNLYVSNGNGFWVCFNPLDAVPSWLQLSLPISNSTYVSGLAVNPANRTEVWATISGYQAGVKVFRSFNGGLNWYNVSLSLPNVPVYSIVFGNNNNNPSGSIYIGTEIGVFYKNDNLPNWVPFSNGLPHVAVTDLQMNYVTSELKASTYGRGIWETGLYEVCSPTVLVDYEINQGQYNYESSNLLYAYHTITGGIGTRVTMKAANKITLLNGFKAYEHTFFKAAIGNCGSGPLGLVLPSSDPETKFTDGQPAKLEQKEN